jgi:ketosteroid isomerase-like protein
MSLDLSAKMLIEWQCTSLAYKAAYHQDNRDFDALALLYTEDAEIHSAIALFQGREAIRALYDKTPSGFTVRHIITNVHFLDVEADQARGVVYNTSYHAIEGQEDENPFVTARMMEFHDLYQRTDAGWLIRSRTSKMVFAAKDWVQETKDWIAKGSKAASGS